MSGQVRSVWVRSVRVRVKLGLTSLGSRIEYELDHSGRVLSDWINFTKSTEDTRDKGVISRLAQLRWGIQKGMEFYQL